MALWNENKEDLTTKTGTTERIEKSGVYEAELKEVYITHSNSSKAMGVTTVFEAPEGTARTTMWHIKGDGTPNKFAERILNRMLYLMKTTVGKLEFEKKKVKLFDGKEIEREYITNLNGKNLGLILEVKVDGDRTNYEIKDFFDIKSKKTADEILNKEDATTYYFFQEKFKDEKPIKKEEETKNEELPDEFPF